MLCSSSSTVRYFEIDSFCSYWHNRGSAESPYSRVENKEKRKKRSTCSIVPKPSLMRLLLICATWFPCTLQQIHPIPLRTNHILYSKSKTCVDKCCSNAPNSMNEWILRPKQVKNKNKRHFAYIHIRQVMFGKVPFSWHSRTIFKSIFLRPFFFVASRWWKTLPDQRNIESNLCSLIA